MLMGEDKYNVFDLEYGFFSVHDKDLTHIAELHDKKMADLVCRLLNENDNKVKVDNDIMTIAGYAECLFFEININGFNCCKDAEKDNSVIKGEGGWCEVCELKKGLKMYPFDE